MAKNKWNNNNTVVGADTVEKKEENKITAATRKGTKTQKTVNKPVEPVVKSVMKKASTLKRIPNDKLTKAPTKNRRLHR